MRSKVSLVVMALVLAVGAGMVKSFVGIGKSTKMSDKSVETRGSSDGNQPTTTQLPGDTRDPQVPPTVILPAGVNDSKTLANAGKRVRVAEISIQRRERQLAAREHALELILDDVRQEHSAFEQKRDQLVKDVKQTVQALEAARKAFDEEQARQDANNARSANKSPSIVVTMAERSMLRKLGSVFDYMPAESAAGIFQQLAVEENSQAGSFETVVKILGSMKERKAQDILAKLQDGYDRDDLRIDGDPQLAANLTRRYLELKKATTPTATP